MDVSGFDWNDANTEKCQKHGVSLTEIEALFAGPVAIVPTKPGTDLNGRSVAIGRTVEGRSLFVVFTLRRRAGVAVLIRPISARYMHEDEVASYEKENPDLPR